jgi:hypothetical protein
MAHSRSARTATLQKVLDTDDIRRRKMVLELLKSFVPIPSRTIPGRFYFLPTLSETSPATLALQDLRFEIVNAALQQSPVSYRQNVNQGGSGRSQHTSMATVN